MPTEGSLFRPTIGRIGPPDLGVVRNRLFRILEQSFMMMLKRVRRDGISNRPVSLGKYLCLIRRALGVPLFQRLLRPCLKSSGVIGKPHG